MKLSSWRKNWDTPPSQFVCFMRLFLCHQGSRQTHELDLIRIISNQLAMQRSKTFGKRHLRVAMMCIKQCVVIYGHSSKTHFSKSISGVCYVYFINRTTYTQPHLSRRSLLLEYII